MRARAGQQGVDADHGQLDEVGGGALQRRVDGGALGEPARVGITAGHVRDGPAAPEQGGHVTVAPHPLDGSGRFRNDVERSVLFNYDRNDSTAASPTLVRAAGMWDLWKLIQSVFLARQGATGCARTVAGI
jgi:hypothetical protein